VEDDQPAIRPEIEKRTRPLLVEPRGTRLNLVERYHPPPVHLVCLEEAFDALTRNLGIDAVGGREVALDDGLLEGVETL
jgi:hypothetical protein